MVEVDVEEYEMQVGDEPARERRNIDASYECDHQMPSPAIVDSHENVGVVDKQDGVTAQSSPP